MSLQHITSPASFRRLVLSLGVGAVACLMVLVGVLAANPAWHELLHDHDHHHGSCSGAHEDSPSESSGPEAGCGVCTFALQQVGLSGLEPVTALVPGGWTHGTIVWSVSAAPQRCEIADRGRGPPSL